MSEEKIYQYNKLWLAEKATSSFLDGLRESLGGDSLKDVKKRYEKRNLPEYAKGSLISPEDSVSLKRAMKNKKTFDINPYLSRFSNFAVPVDLVRYEKCERSILGGALTTGTLYSVSRPLITFLTTTDKAKKLKYLDSQRPRYSYMIINYKDIKKFRTTQGLGSELGRERVRLPSKTIYRRSKDFDNYTVKVSPDGENIFDKGSSGKRGILQIPTQIEFSKDYQPKVRTMKSYRIKTEEEYERLFSDFKENTNRRVNQKVNLDDWSFCIVFYRKWCDKSVLGLGNYLGLKKIVGGISESKIFTPSPGESYGFKEVFNTDLTGRDIEFNMLSFLESSFGGAEIKEPIPYFKTGNLDNFDIIMETFQKFRDGGHWIRKIRKDGKTFYEETEGPYEKSEAITRAKILNNSLTLEGVKTAEIYTFFQLVCDDSEDEKEYRNNIGSYVKPENRFFPPPGSKLFCLIYGNENLAVYELQNLYKNFKKFSDFAYDEGVRYVKHDDENFVSHLIFYKPESPGSIQKLEDMKILLDKRDGLSDGEFLWCKDFIMGRKIKRGNKPRKIPFPEREKLFKDDMITYRMLMQIQKNFEKMDCNGERQKSIFQALLTTFPEEYIRVYKEGDSLHTNINMGVVMNEEDNMKKKMTISKNGSGEFRISMERLRKVLNNMSLISIENIRNCQGTMKINFNNLREKMWEKSKMEIVSGDTRFNNETILIALTLFVGKCFGLERVILDTSRRSYECDTEVEYSHFHIYYLSKGGLGKFKELTFGMENEKSYKEIVGPLMEMTLFNFSIESGIKIKVTKELKNQTVSQFCKNFTELEECPQKDVLLIAAAISVYIDSFTRIKVSSPIGSVEFSKLLEYIDRE